MYYPDEIIEEVRSKNDIVDVISGYVRLQKKGANYVGLCPFHNEKTGSFSVSRSKQMFYCFGCHEGGNVITFIMKYENATFSEALEKLAERASITLPKYELSEEQKRKAGKKNLLLEINKEAARYFYYQLRGNSGKHGMDYFLKRQLSEETINAFGLGFALPFGDDLVKYLKSKDYKDADIIEAGLASFDEKRGLHDKFWNRVMFPIQDINHRVIGFGGRVMGEGEPKYLNSPETPVFDKSRNLFGLNFARSSKKDYLILCEGYMDVIAMHQAGFKEAVASLGTAFTSGQANLLKRFCNSVILSYDSDGAGTSAALRAIGILREVDLNAKVLDLKPYKDPDEFVKNMGVEAYEERINQAVPGRIFEIDQIAKKYNFSNPDEKTEFMHGAAAILAGIEDPAERTNYVESVSEKFRCDFNELKKLVTKAGLAGMKEVSSVETRQRYTNERIKDKNPYLEAEEYLMSLMISDTSLFNTLSGIVDENDFTEPGTKEVAKAVFDMYREKGEVNPATILNGFEEAELQERVTAMMTRSFDFDTGPEALSKALTDIVRKVKINNIEKEQRGGSGSQIELARKKNQVRNLVITIRR